MPWVGIPPRAALQKSSCPGCSRFACCAFAFLPRSFHIHIYIHTYIPWPFTETMTSMLVERGERKSVPLKSRYGQEEMKERGAMKTLVAVGSMAFSNM